MIDYSKTPLTEKQMLLLSVIRAGMFTNPDTGQTFVSKAYWNGITPGLRDALTRALMAVGREGGDHE